VGSSASAYRLARPYARQGARRLDTLQASHNNTSVVYDERLIMKLFRCVDAGANPEVEIGDYLTAKGFEHTPPVVAALEYRPSQGETICLATLQGFVPNQGEAWDYTQAELAAFFERARAAGRAPDVPPLSTAGLLDLAEREPADEARALAGGYLDAALLLGRRTAELHLALASDTANPDFAPQPFTPLYQRSLYQSMRSLVGHAVYMLRRDIARLPGWARADARAILDLEDALLARLRGVADQKIDALRTRIHGDYHLAQVLYTGDDFVIFDFEGEPDRPVVERRLRVSPLRDVAAMLRSLHYATYAARLKGADDLGRAWEDAEALEPWAHAWYGWAAGAFLRGYLATARQGEFLPASRDELRVLLDALLLERAIYELRHELDNRLAWVRIALRGIEQLLGEEF
jgi:maltose alpha-D-glucosyltransferase/alpha-amylase